METLIQILEAQNANIARLAAEVEALKSKVQPEYNLLDDAKACVRFNLNSVREAAQLRLSAQGPRAAVDGKNPLVSESEWIAFFQRQEKSRGVRQ